MEQGRGTIIMDGRVIPVHHNRSNARSSDVNYTKKQNHDRVRNFGNIIVACGRYKRILIQQIATTAKIRNDIPLPSDG